jgi:hypothetical protein
MGGLAEGLAKKKSLLHLFSHVSRCCSHGLEYRLRKSSRVTCVHVNPVFFTDIGTFLSGPGSNLVACCWL